MSNYTDLYVFKWVKKISCSYFCFWGVRENFFSRTVAFYSNINHCLLRKYISLKVVWSKESLRT